MLFLDDLDHTYDGLYKITLEDIDMEKCSEADVGLLCSDIHAIRNYFE